MTELRTGPLLENRRLEALGLDAWTSTGGQVFDAAAAETWTRNPGPSAWRWARRSVWRPIFSDEPRLSAEEANERWGIEGELSFDAPVFEASARELHGLKREELQRRSILLRAEGGLLQGLGQLGVGFLLSAVDPVNVGASFIPVVGPTRYAAMLAEAGGALARAGVRARVGALAGLAGAAAVEPIVWGVAADEQADYGAADAILNLAFGTLLGGGLHSAAGAVGDAWSGRYRAPAAGAAAAASPRTREAALRGAVAELADGGRVESAEPLLWVGRPEAGGAPASPPPAEATAPVFDASGRRIDTRYRVVEAERLVASHHDDLSVNPAFPAELQPRQRERAAAEAQISAIAADLQPERLGRSNDAATGAPIVAADLVVESGNGRVLALRRVLEQGGDAAERYRRFLVDQGFDVGGMKAPVLVRERTSPLTPEERRAFAVDAQSSATLSLSATERAMADAPRLDQALGLWQGGSVGDARNAAFVRAFIAALPQAEQGALLAKGGELSREGLRRIENALLARAYGDPDLVGRMVEAADDGSRSLGAALMEVAPDWARLRDAAARGEVAQGVDATGDLLDAVRAIRDARAAGRPLAEILQQLDAFAQRSPATDLFLGRILKRSGSRVTTRSAKDIAEGLRAYLDEAMKSRPGADMFGAPPADAAAVLRALAARDRRSDRQAEEAIEAAARRAPESLTPDAALQAAEQAEADADAMLAALQAAGRLPETAPELDQAAALKTRAAREAKATQAAGACLLKAA